MNFNLKLDSATCPKCLGPLSSNQGILDSCAICAARDTSESVNAFKPAVGFSSPQPKPHIATTTIASANQVRTDRKVSTKSLVHTLVSGLLVVVVLYNLWPRSEFMEWHPVIDAEPLQQLVTEPKIWNHKGFQFEQLATYKVQALVLATERYRFDGLSELSPIDLGIGWKTMSRASIINQLDISQSGRFMFFSSKSDLSIPEEIITNSVSNNHMIPSKNYVQTAIFKAKRGDIVEFEGDLVKVSKFGEGEWRSSLSRNDSGAGACEVVWVKSFKILPAVTKPSRIAH